MITVYRQDESIVIIAVGRHTNEGSRRRSSLKGSETYRRVAIADQTSRLVARTRLRLRL